MKADLTVWLSGLGYYKMSERRRKMLTYMLLGSLAVHVIGLIAFGSWVLIRSYMDEKTVFVAPPPLKTYEPRKLEHKVKVQKRQRSSSRPTIMPRMVSTRPSALSLPEIKLDPKVVRTTFQPNFKAVSGQGMGVGLGAGLGLGGFGQGVSQFDFFGIRGRGARVAICVDVSGSMVEEERGGLEGMNRVKMRINKVIDALNEQTLFSLIVFADEGAAWKPEMVPATAKNKQDAKLFLQPFNTSFEQAGVVRGNLQPSDKGLKALGGTTRLDLALTAAFQHGADTILIISDGEPLVRKEPTAEQLAEWNARMEQWRRENEAALARAAAVNTGGGAVGSNQPVEYREERVWVPPRPYREGQPAQPGHWVTRRVPVGGYRGGHDWGRVERPRPPEMPRNMQWWTLPDFIEHFGLLQEAYYTAKGRKPPVVHAIGYGIDKEGEAFLRAFTKQYNGNFRKVAKVD